MIYSVSSAFKQKPELAPQRIAVLRALAGLGDFLCVVPAFRALRSTFPQAEIVLIGLPSVQPLCDRFQHYLDRLLPFPGFPGLPEQPLSVEQIPTFLASAHHQSFDWVLQLHGSGVITNPIAVLLGAKLTAGFYLPDQFCPNPETFLPYDPQESEVRRYLRLLAHLGISTQGESLEFPVNVDDRQALHAIPATQGLRPSSYVCVHPGASVESRRWSIEQFAQVADTLADQGFQVVLTGSQQELDVVEGVRRQMRSPSINLAGQTSLGSLAVLLQSARLLVCNDTGVSHLAAALQVPSVVIFTGSDPARWAPLNRDRHRVVCANTTTATTVIAQVQALLEDANVA